MLSLRKFLKAGVTTGDVPFHFEESGFEDGVLQFTVPSVDDYEVAAVTMA